MPPACRVVWMLVFPLTDLSSAEGTVGARARERVVGGSAYDPVALSVAGRTSTMVGGSSTPSLPEKDK
jgi:hypothetical protein